MPRRQHSSRPATLADAIRIFDLDADNPIRGEWRVLGPHELCDMIVTSPPPQALAPPVAPESCTVCGGAQRVPGKVAGLTVRCPSCAPRLRSPQLSLRKWR